MNKGAAANPLTRYLGQAVLYGLFAAAIGYFSTSPAYTHLAPDQALIKLSFSHTAQRVGECRRRSDEEMAALAPNMRIREECPRERAPVIVELDVDGVLQRAVLQAAGLSRDAAASIYRRFTVPAGEHLIAARLSDRADGAFDFSRQERIELEPAQILVVEFHAASGGFRFLHSEAKAHLDRD